MSRCDGYMGCPAVSLLLERCRESLAKRTAHRRRTYARSRILLKPLRSTRSLLFGSSNKASRLSVPKRTISGQQRGTNPFQRSKNNMMKEISRSIYEGAEERLASDRQGFLLSQLPGHHYTKCGLLPKRHALCRERSEGQGSNDTSSSSRLAPAQLTDEIAAT